MPQLSLDCLCLTDTPPEEQVRAAAAAGFDLVSIWVAPPMFPRAGVNAGNLAELNEVMAQTGVKAHGVEVFDLVSDEALESYRPRLELAAAAGGKCAVLINAANPEREEVVRLMAKFVPIAAEYGLVANFEPVYMGRTRTLAEGAALIADAGFAPDGPIGLTYDFLHAVRTGQTMADIRAIDARLIRYVQVCDGAMFPTAEQQANEAIFLRPLPGQGEFPIAELMSAIPPHAIVAVECPDLARLQSGASPQVLARDAMAALAAFL